MEWVSIAVQSFFIYRIRYTQKRIVFVLKFFLSKKSLGKTKVKTLELINKISFESFFLIY